MNETQVALILERMENMGKDIHDIKSTNKEILYPLREWKILTHYKVNAICWAIGIFVTAAIFQFAGGLFERFIR